MANIVDINEPWRNHDGIEVETWIKSMFASTLATLGGKVGYVELSGSSLVFYDEQGGTVISTISLSGDVYNIAIACNLDPVFYVLADETTKMMTITPSTTVSQFGSSDSQPFPEGYSYTVYVNTGGGYVPRITGQIPTGGSATFDIRPFLATGDNYIRVAVTGDTSQQVRTAVFTGTLTTLTMSVNHTWQNVWEQGQSYTISGIRFSGNLVKRLHVAVDGTEVGYVDYTANQSYTTTPTSYTIDASNFPALSNGTHEVSLWMTAQGVSTRVFAYNIMCIATGDTTPVVTINAITPTAVNWTSGKLFSYAVWGADKATFDLSAILGEIGYQITDTPVAVENLVENTQYDFNYAIEIDTGVNEVPLGTLTIEATAFLGAVEGESITVTTALDNTYSYLATPGALFYMNASTRSNSESNRDYIVNEMGASQDGNFAASYQGTWTGFAWNGDAWDSDSGGNRALRIPAGCSLSVADFAPLGLLTQYPTGMTFEVMIKNEYPADYDTAILSLVSTVSGGAQAGILIYPTKIVCYGSNERSEVNQTVNISENRMTHLVVTFVKNYEGVSGRNLVSIYVNGISNINFAFDTQSNFGNGSLVVGQPDTDVFIYRMRVYGTALDSRAVFNNFLNSVIDGVEFNRRERMEKNNIYEGPTVDYEAVKKAGFNTMVIIMTDDQTPLPSIDHPAPSDGWPNCTMRFEYADDSTKNVTVGGVSIDGQGTTSKKYYRWNIRAKTKSSTTWEYGDGTTATGKKGKFINDDDYVKVDRITAKKNYASSMQGHKMGFTGLYNDLYKGVGLGSHLPDSDFRVAVYQFPFVGFRYYEANDSYEYIGQYTAGPDKGSKVTFGYSDDYMSLMSIEGPNHSPRGTRFLHPWVDVEYSVEDESLFIGGVEAWDADFVNYETSSEGTPADWAAIRQLYETEWRPAYENVYNNSPHIASVAEVIAAVNNPSITTLADILNPANASTIIGVTVPGMLVPIQNIAIYDTSYELYFYREKTKEIVSLASVDSNLEHNVLTALSGYLTTQTPSTSQIIAARAARFKATAPNYWDMDQTLFHACFRELFAVSDNDAKNSYPFKFVGYSEDLPTGANINCKRWGWRQDDMDTVMMTDNNGNNTKSYSVEPGDTIGANRDQIFQGFNSALWVLVRDNYPDELRTMMLSIVSAASALATSYGVAGDGLHGSLFSLTSYYCWEHSAKYFAELLYEEDRRWAYIQPWLENPSAVYNSVPPLTQALGDQYQAERLWMERRIAYIFSKYRIGAFNGATEGYHEIAFTLAAMFKFYLTPAIDLYPTAATGSTTVQAARTEAGTPAEITLTTTGDTTNYIKGGDWLADLGDLAGMALSARGGGDIAFNLNCARLKRLKIGDEVAAKVLFNAMTFAISSPSITEIDARNTATLRNLVNLMSCPRLRKVLFEGSGATGLVLPVGAKVTEVSFPSEADSVFLSNLPFLENEGLTLPNSDAIVMLYVKDCPNLDPLGIAEDALEAQGSTLAFVTLGWANIIIGDADTKDTILALAELSGKVVYENGLVPVEGKPSAEGIVRFASGLYADDITDLDLVNETTIGDGWKEGLSRLFDGGLLVQYNPAGVYIRFVDAEVQRICATTWGDGSGITMGQAEAVTNLSTYFNGNTLIETFDELGAYFIGLTSIYGSSSSPYGAFGGCTSLESITLPSSLTTIGAYAFYGCTSLASITIPSSVTTLGTSCFYGCSNLSGTVVIPSSVITTNIDMFYNCGNIEYLIIKKTTNTGFRHIQRCATNGIIYADCDITGAGSSGVYSACAHFITTGNFTSTTYGPFRANTITIRIGGDYSAASNTVGLVDSGSNNTAAGIRLIEVMGTITNALISVSNNRYSTSGLIIHLGYNGIACTPNRVNVSNSKIAKVYVGDGSSQAGDQAILNMYLADEAWAAYSSKLDLWYNYDGEYKTPPTIPTV